MDQVYRSSGRCIVIRGASLEHAISNNANVLISIRIQGVVTRENILQGCLKLKL